MRLLVVDNYDSFTWNLVHLAAPLTREIEVARNDAVTVEAIAAMAPDAIILSPGPCTPREAGVCLDLIRREGARLPMLGVCLGMQAIGEAFGGEVVRAPVPMHGKISEVRHTGEGVFRGLNDPFRATRYHSLIVARDSRPPELRITAETEDGLIMGLSHARLPIHGVQFHPESIASEQGEVILRNFLDLAAAWNASRDKPAAGMH